MQNSYSIPRVDIYWYEGIYQSCDPVVGLLSQKSIQYSAAPDLFYFEADRCNTFFLDCAKALYCDGKCPPSFNFGAAASKFGWRCQAVVRPKAAGGWGA